MAVPSRSSRIVGCLLGGAVGDALGAPVEFDSLDELRGRFGAEGIEELAPAFGRVGAVTDDTQMTLFTAEGLLRAEVRRQDRGICHPASVIHHAYLRWLATQDVAPRARGVGAAGGEWPDGWLVRQRELWARRAPGTTCVTALAAAEALGEPARNDSKGCGTVMRVAPVGLALSENGAAAFELAVEASRLTHGHPTGQLAAGCFAQVLAHVAEGRELEPSIVEARHSAFARPDAEETVRAVDAALALAGSGRAPSPELVESLGAGWVAEEAVAIALYSALVARDFEHGVRLAVNHGGDSDSTGSLTGNLLGALWGRESIPERWLASLELAEVIEELGRDLAALREGRFAAGASREKYPGW